MRKAKENFQLASLLINTIMDLEAYMYTGESMSKAEDLWNMTIEQLQKKLERLANQIITY